MATPFSRTLRSFGADDFRFGGLSLLAALLIIIGWVAWICYARIPIYVVSKSARLEPASPLFYVASQISGRVKVVHMTVGDEVKAGDVLFELGAEESQLDLAQVQTRQAADTSQIEALLSEMRNEEEALTNERQAGRVALEEARSHYHELDEGARFAKNEVDKMMPLYKQGILAEIEYLRLRSEAERRQAQAEAVRLSLDRLVWEERSKENNRKARLANLKTEVVRIQGNIATSKVAGERFIDEVSRHLVRSPVTGRVGELSNLRVGSVVHVGEKLGAIVPEGELRVAAFFSPDVALGRIHIGQTASLRLDGFPWTQYGTLPMSVENISNEARDGQVRIELKLKSTSNGTSIPIQHGLTGSVEVEVEQISPATAFLRTIGKG